MQHDPYHPHLRFIAPAAGDTQTWRVVACLLAFEVGLFAAGVISYGDGMVDVSSPRQTVVEFASFGAALAVFLFAFRRLHHRGLASLLGQDVQAQFIRAGTAVALVLLVVQILPPGIDKHEIAYVRPFGPWLMWLLLAVPAITLQAGTEEIVFRGYFQQQLAVRFRQRWIWMGVPSVLFGASHYFNAWGPADGVLWAIWATLLGLACADLTARTGNVGAAIGLHTATNVFAVAFVAVEDWPTSGLARYVYSYVDPADYDYSLATLGEAWAIFELLVSCLGVLVMWLAARNAVRR